jgi:ATP-dependent DNA ligase
MSENQLDGFSGLSGTRRARAIQLLRRNGNDLSPWFLEVIRTGEALPPNTVLDGEVVVADDRGCSDFGALDARLGVAKRDETQIVRSHRI